MMGKDVQDLLLILINVVSGSYQTDFPVNTF